MTTYDMKTISANTAGPASNSSVVFGADNQGAATPVPYAFSAFRTAVQGVLYNANRWYLPGGLDSISAGSAPGAGTIRFTPGFIFQKTTIQALGTYISTASAAQNIQLAVYANSSAMRPTGNPLASTANISVASTGGVSGAASVQLDTGWYWFAANASDGVVVINAVSAGAIMSVSGGTNITDVIASGNASSLSFTQTFGTWPDMTAQTASRGFSIAPAILFQTVSVP